VDAKKVGRDLAEAIEAADFFDGRES